LSIIELAEPAEVPAGSPSYKIEWRGKIFVQPLYPEATTNRFNWTVSGGLATIWSHSGRQAKALVLVEVRAR
jgi:hypothetical protein